MRDSMMRRSMTHGSMMHGSMMQGSMMLASMPFGMHGSMDYSPCLTWRALLTARTRRCAARMRCSV